MIHSTAALTYNTTDMLGEKDQQFSMQMQIIWYTLPERAKTHFIIKVQPAVIASQKTIS